MEPEKPASEKLKNTSKRSISTREDLPSVTELRMKAVIAAESRKRKAEETEQPAKRLRQSISAAESRSSSPVSDEDGGEMTPLARVDTYGNSGWFCTGPSYQCPPSHVPIQISSDPTSNPFDAANMIGTAGEDKELWIMRVPAHIPLAHLISQLNIPLSHIEDSSEPLCLIEAPAPTPPGYRGPTTNETYALLEASNERLAGAPVMERLKCLVPDGEAGNLVLAPIPTARYLEILPNIPGLPSSSDVATAGRRAKRRVAGERATMTEAEKYRNQLIGKIQVGRVGSAETPAGIKAGKVEMKKEKDKGRDQDTKAKGRAKEMNVRDR
ncbi:hypothetical protein HDU93_003174 [Gonapodya sp. JEL0774]|nr:hypothetical protein HDU93_003174 [Gonapodya sp. JEL0774]